MSLSWWCICYHGYILIEGSHNCERSGHNCICVQARDKYVPTTRCASNTMNCIIDTPIVEYITSNTDFQLALNVTCIEQHYDINYDRKMYISSVFRVCFWVHIVRILLKPDLFHTVTSLDKEQTGWSNYNVKMTRYSMEQPQSGGVTVIYDGFLWKVQLLYSVTVKQRGIKGGI